MLVKAFLIFTVFFLIAVQQLNICPKKSIVHQQHFKYSQCSFPVQHWSLPAFCTVELYQLYRSWIRCWAVTVLLSLQPRPHSAAIVPLSLAAVGCLEVPLFARRAQHLSLLKPLTTWVMRVLYQRAQSESSPENCSMDMLTCSINIWEQRDHSNAFSCPE